MALKKQNKKHQGLPDYKKCQVFTPSSIADKMIDAAWNQLEMRDATFLECSCGDGAIITRFVERYIQTFLGFFSPRELKNRLERQFVGCEIDAEKLDICRANLNSLALKYFIPEVNWNLVLGDFLEETFPNKFDVIIGNPPYVSYINLSLETRTRIKKEFRTCAKGKFDYCFPFIEKCVFLLSDVGQLVFITPESIFKTLSAIALRSLMIPYLYRIDGSLTEGAFEDVRVTPSIFHLKKGSFSETFLYRDKAGSDHVLNKEQFVSNNKWSFMQQPTALPSARFGDLFNVSCSVATLDNDVFVLHGGYFDGDLYVCASGEPIERALVKKAIAPNYKRKGIDAYIIYPYDGSSSFGEEAFKEQYPLAYSYLQRRKERLIDRDLDRSASWFEYGRKQSLGLTAVEKYCLSIFVTGGPSLWKCDADSVVFSGLIISGKKNGLPLRMVPNILSSSSFLRYAESVGIPCSNGSWRITATDLKEYAFDETN